MSPSPNEIQTSTAISEMWRNKFARLKKIAKTSKKEKNIEILPRMCLSVVCLLFFFFCFFFFFFSGRYFGTNQMKWLQIPADLWEVEEALHVRVPKTEHPCQWLGKKLVCWAVTMVYHIAKPWTWPMLCAVLVLEEKTPLRILERIRFGRSLWIVLSKQLHSTRSMLSS